MWIIGRDDSDPNFQVLDADSRGVSRVYHMSFAAPDWGMWRTTPEFAQHFEAVIAVEGRRISGAWTKSTDGRRATWERDFNVDYIRMSLSDPD